MKPSLQLKLSQHLALTPQLQQSIKLLQLSTLEFNQEIERFLADNPLLEREDNDPSTSLYAGKGSDALNNTEAAAPAQEEGSSYQESAADAVWNESSTPSGPGGGSRSPDDEESDFQEFHAAAVSLRDHLGSQLALLPLTDRDRTLAHLLVEALDDDGYLGQDLAELLEIFPEDQEVELEDLQIALKHLQNLDPVGIAARNPQECLALQLQVQPQSRCRDVALSIVRQHLDMLAARDYIKLRKALGCTEDTLRQAHALICSLNPRPGAAYAPADTRFVVPDVTVRKFRNEWVVNLNQEAMPRLRINRLYAEILQGSRGSGLSGQLQEAKWLIKNVQQRFDTILRVSQAIVERQRQFFEYGEVAMRPLTLREIADQVELHESTISRVTTQKYMATPRGIYELKYFFGSHVSTETGGAASSTAIRALIKQLVGAEDTRKPLSDARIAEVLGEQGIVVARRTIAKYREALNIPPVSLRKSI